MEERLKAFDWEIGTVPEGWVRAYGAPSVINGDFRDGPMAAMMPPLYPPCAGGLYDNLCGYQFHYGQRHKVKAWLDWFMKEYDE